MPTPEKTNQEKNPKFKHSGKHGMVWTDENIDWYFDTMFAEDSPEAMLFCHGCGKSLLGIKHRKKKWCLPCAKYIFGSVTNTKPVKRKYETK